MKKRILSVLLVFVLALSLLPVSVLAGGGGGENVQPTTQMFAWNQVKDDPKTQAESEDSGLLGKVSVTYGGTSLAMKYQVAWDTVAGTNGTGVTITADTGYRITSISLRCNDEEGAGCNTFASHQANMETVYSSVTTEVTLTGSELAAMWQKHAAISNGVPGPHWLCISIVEDTSEYTVTYQNAETGAPALTGYVTDGVFAAGALTTNTANPQTGLKWNESITVDSLTEEVINAAKDEGYEFSGWKVQYQAADGSWTDATGADGNPVAVKPDDTVAVHGNVRLIAQWEEIPAPTTGTLTVTKTVSGLDAGVSLPEDFTITVTRSGESSAAYTLTVGQTGSSDVAYLDNSGVHTWTISNVPLGSYSVAETNNTVGGYALDTQNSTTGGSATLSASALTASAGLVNVYIKDAPGLAVTKTLSKVNGVNYTSGEVVVGDELLYTITVTNTGNVALSGIAVSDVLQYKDAAPSAGGTSLTLYSDEACTIPATSPFALAVSGTNTLYARYTVAAADAGKTLVNTAAANNGSASGEGTSEVTVTEQHTVTVEYYLENTDAGSKLTDKTAAVTLNKGDAWEVTVGGTDSTVTHNAPQTITVGEGEDAVQYAFDPLASDTVLSGTVGTGDVIVRLVYSKDVIGETDPTGPDTIPDRYQVTVEYVSADESMGTENGNTEVLTIRDGSGKYLASGTVAISGAAAAEITGYAFTAWTAASSVAGETVSFAVDSSDARILTAQALQVTGGAVYTFTANFEGYPVVSVDKTLKSEMPENGFCIGDVVEWEIKVSNTGTAAASGLCLSDTLTIGERTVSLTPEAEGLNADDFDVAAGEYVTFTAAYTVTKDDLGLVLSNKAVVTVSEDDKPEDSDNQGKVENPYSKLGVSKTRTTAAKVKVGDTIEWTITITNSGNSEAKNVVIEDVLSNGGAVTVTLDGEAADSVNVPAQGSVTLQASYQVVDADAGKILTNTVTVYTDSTDRVSDTDEGTEVERISTPVTKPSSLQMEKGTHFNYILGYSDGTIRPGNEITRAEVAIIFFRLLTDESRNAYYSEHNDFTDVADTSKSNIAISTLAKAGILTGYSDGTFRPNARVTRGQLAAIIARFADMKGSVNKTFTDIDGYWAKDLILLAASNGWIDGYGDGTFRPDRNITRAETMAIINRALDRQVSTVEDLLDNMNVWVDNMDPRKWYYFHVQEATNYHEYVRKEGTLDETWTKKLPDIDWSVYQY